MARQGQLDQAITHWQRAVQADPDQATTHTSLGTALARQGQSGAGAGDLTTRQDPAHTRSRRLQSDGGGYAAGHLRQPAR
ncbi:MAG TPA: tetratricopeptide repeat protein [Phycisphaerae bacterium]|nr:tetratricopeptide repeat protein [Phycisphaerae bacterium]HDZ43075.1 tetratricopeptide repeat protein [Phycisphaerae bacterium]